MGWRPRVDKDGHHLCDTGHRLLSIHVSIEESQANRTEITILNALSTSYSYNLHVFLFCASRPFLAFHNHLIDKLNEKCLLFMYSAIWYEQHNRTQLVFCICRSARDLPMDNAVILDLYFHFPPVAFQPQKYYYYIPHHHYLSFSASYLRPVARLPILILGKFNGNLKTANTGFPIFPFSFFFASF